MFWLFLATYVLAGATIGRMTWEFDVYADSPRYDRLLCVVTAIAWPVVPAWGLWALVRSWRR